MARTTNADGSRTYSVPDPQTGEQVELPSVTTILRVVDKPALMYWAAKGVATYAVENHAEVGALLDKGDKDGAIRLLKGSIWDKRDKAADVGTIVHDTIEQLTLGMDVDVPVAAKRYVDAWGEFIRDYKGEFEASEMTVYSMTHRYAGTLDALYRFGDRLGCIDYKTRQGKKAKDSSAYETERLQVAAYAKAEFVLLPDGSTERLPKIDGGSILMLCDDGYAVTKIDLASDFPAFLAARTLFEWKEAL